MDLYEYQARDVFEQYGVPVLAGIIADTPEDARAAAEKIGGVVVVKAQVKTGGRGKAGGVKVAKTPDEAFEAAKAILGLDIKGHVVKRVMVAAGARIAQEFYFSIPLETYDLCVYAEKNNTPVSIVSKVLNITEEQVKRIARNIKQKRSATDYLRQTLSLP